MGRAAGHLALGIGKAAAATLTIIPEEFRGRAVSIDEVCDILVGSIVKRRSANLNYGVAVLAEGLIEAIGEKGLETMLNGEQLGRYGNISRDDHGHLRLGDIDFGRMMKDALNQKLKALGLEITVIDKELGYELRCADPIPFDAEYTRDLGYGAVQFLFSEESAKYGAIISLEGGHLRPLPFETMINPETRRMRTRRVDVDGESYRCARAYMIRLEKRDVEEPARLGRIAEAANMSPEQFRQRYAAVATDG
jgi:6-phosphofructokinase 1